MNKDELLQVINTDLGYNFESDLYGFNMLTRTRYTNVNSIPAAYFASLDKTKLYKITCEDVSVSDLPNQELETFNEIEIQD